MSRRPKEHATLQQTLFPIERPANAPTPEGAKEKNGVVYTKPWVVELILDATGYVASAPLHERLLVEPSAGDGSFLLGAVERLVESCRSHGVPVGQAGESIAAFELDPRSVENARRAVQSRLMEHGVASSESERLAASWVRCADYLLETGEYTGRADFVVGNPPYIRLEDLDNGGAVYRSHYPTMVGRADIYVAFYEAALRHLKPGGVCGFICADRWMFNQYGAALRAFVTRGFSVDTVVSMHHADAFETEVSAYPAVTMIRRGAQGPVVVSALEPDAERVGGPALSKIFERVRDTGTPESREGVVASRVDSWFIGDEPWPLMEPGKMALLKRLEVEFLTLEATGTTVGIGVATGRGQGLHHQGRLARGTGKALAPGDGLRRQGVRARLVEALSGQPLERQGPGRPGQLPEARRVLRRPQGEAERPPRRQEGPGQLVPNHRPG